MTTMDKAVIQTSFGRYCEITHCARKSSDFAKVAHLLQDGDSYTHLL